MRLVCQVFQSWLVDPTLRIQKTWIPLYMSSSLSKHENTIFIFYYILVRNTFFDTNWIIQRVDIKSRYFYIFNEPWTTNIIIKRLVVLVTINFIEDLFLKIPHFLEIKKIIDLETHLTFMLFQQFVVFFYDVKASIHHGFIVENTVIVVQFFSDKIKIIRTW